MKKPIRRVLFLTLSVLSITTGGMMGASTPAHANDLTEAGDVLQIALPVTAFLSTYLYEDPEGRAQFSKAFLTKNVAISDIDGKTVFVTARNWWVPIVTQTRAAVIPGEHSLTITYAQTGWSSLGCTVTIDAQPGKTYVVKAKRVPAEESTGFKTVKKPQIRRIGVWIEDEETGATIINETACRPVTS